MNRSLSLLCHTPDGMPGPGAPPAARGAEGPGPGAGPQGTAFPVTRRMAHLGDPTCLQ